MVLDSELVVDMEVMVNRRADYPEPIYVVVLNPLEVGLARVIRFDVYIAEVIATSAIYKSTIGTKTAMDHVWCRSASTTISSRGQRFRANMGETKGVRHPDEFGRNRTQDRHTQASRQQRRPYHPPKAKAPEGESICNFDVHSIFIWNTQEVPFTPETLKEITIA